MTDRALRMLYREIPSVTGCKDGCGRCCGPVPWSPAELKRIAGRVPPHAVWAPASDGCPEIVMLVDAHNPTACPMLDDQKRCTVYDARPAMCRLFGAVDGPGLVCPFGARATRPLSDAKARALVNRYKSEASR